MEKLRIGYIVDKQTIDQDSIKEFELMTNRRRLREEQVKKIKRMILHDEHFDSPLIVSESNGKKRILDGQHRISAISQIINQNPNFQIEVTIIKYSNLSPEEEKDTFTRWNSGTRQSTEDFITMHLDDIKIFSLFDRWKNDEDFPVEVTIYKGKDGSVQFRNMIEPYIFAKEKILGNTFGPPKFVEKAKELGKKDYEWIKKFVEDFIKNVGGFNKENIFSRIGGLSPMMFLYMNGDLNPKTFWKRFEKVKKSKAIKEIIFIGGFAAKRKIKDMMVEKMGITKVEEKVVPKGPETIFTEDRIEWLRKNWPRSTWNIEDIAQEFDEKFGTKIVIGSLRSVLTKNKIRKDPEFAKRGPTNIYTPKVIEFMKKCADEGMSSREAKEEAQKEFGHLFSIMTFRLYSSKKGIKFRLGSPKPQFSKKIEKIIEDHKDLISEEIRDKIIEKTGENISAGEINHYLGRNRYTKNKEEGMTKKEIQKSLKDMGAEDEEDTDFLEED